MKGIALFVFGLIILFGADAADSFPVRPGENDLKETSKAIYRKLGNESLSFEAFYRAYQGWSTMKDSLQLDDQVISIIDFSQSSNNKRFYLIDIKANKVLYQDYVAHGKNSGELWAKSFSNIVNSNQSSLGFYKTAETYFGKHGLSLRLDGLEAGINHNARERAIVVHSAKYATESFIKKYGRLGRSFGCPALPADNYQEIVNLIKEGTLLFIYFPDDEYLRNSHVLN